MKSNKMKYNQSYHHLKISKSEFQFAWLYEFMFKILKTQKRLENLTFSFFAQFLQLEVNFCSIFPHLIAVFAKKQLFHLQVCVRTCFAFVDLLQWKYIWFDSLTVRKCPRKKSWHDKCITKRNGKWKLSTRKEESTCWNESLISLLVTPFEKAPNATG